MNDKLANKVRQYDFATLFKNKGYAFFTKGAYNLNIIAIRSKESHIQADKFDDIMIVDYNNYTQHVRKIYTITTDPGLESLRKPVNAKGCAILAEGQYRKCWTTGYHKGKYPALVQCAPVKVYRDNNRDNILDFNAKTCDYGVFGINIHRSNPATYSTVVGSWSAGCIVFSVVKEFMEFMDICNNQIKNGLGNKFTCTLINEEDL